MFNYKKIDDRWKMIEGLVQTKGNSEEKKAWSLCKEDFTDLLLKVNDTTKKRGK